MRGFVGLGLLVALLAAATPAAAGKIGFLDPDRAIAGVKEGRAKLRALQEWERPERARVEALRVQVAEIRQRIAQQRPVASDEVLQSLEEEELRARRAHEDASRAFERDFKVKQQEFLGDVAVRIGAVASDYARANGYDAIFVFTAQPLVYIDENADITDTVIQLFDERFPYGDD